MKIEKVTLKPNVKTSVSPDKNTKYIVSFPSFNKTDIYDFDVEPKVEGVEVEVFAPYLVGKDQFLTFRTLSHHTVPHTSCLVTVKGVLADNAVSNYVGKIIIDKSAQQTSSYLKHNVLVTGNETKNATQPILQIEADDVKASHGATTGRVDETQVYYLMSRGLKRVEAIDLIIEGFLGN